MTSKSADHGAVRLPSLLRAAKNFIYLSVGQIAYRISALALLSVYASTLGPEQFGRLEQLLALSMLAVPLLSLQAYESFLPFFYKDNAAGASTAAVILLCAVSVVAIGSLIVFFHQSSSAKFVVAIAAHVNAAMLWQYVRNMLRVTQRYDVAMQSEVIQSIVALVLGGFLLFKVNFGISGVLVAIATGNICAISYASVRSARFKELLSKKAVTGEAVRSLLSVSARLVPNVVLWWGIELSDRLLLAYFSGDQSVGVYAAGSRIAGVLLALFLLLYQVWQIPAISALEKGSGQSFFVSSFRLYVLAVTACASILIAAAEPLTLFLLGPEFRVSLKYTAILVPAVCLAAFCYFFGIVYYSTVERFAALKASIAGLAVSLAINLSCISYFGPIAAAAATFVAYLVMCVIRYAEARQRLGLRVDWREYWLPFTVISGQSLGLYFNVAPAWLCLGIPVLLIGAHKEFAAIFGALRGFAGAR